MSINIDQLLNEIKEVVNYSLTSENLSTPPDFLYRRIIAAIQDKYAIVPTNVSSNNYHVSRFQELVASWVDGDIDSNNVNAEQIIYHLANEGWLIIPPQT